MDRLLQYSQSVLTNSKASIEVDSKLKYQGWFSSRWCEIYIYGYENMVIG